MSRPSVTCATTRARRAASSALAGRGVRTYLLTGPSPASDDVGALADGLGCPLVYWFLGASDPDLIGPGSLAHLGSGAPPVGVPAIHAPDFAPHPDTVVHATRALLVAAGAWLG